MSRGAFMYRSTFQFAFIVTETANEIKIMTMCLCNEGRKRSVILSYNYLNFIMPKANDQCVLAVCLKSHASDLFSFVCFTV